jgi:hypothetical protein
VVEPISADEAKAFIVRYEWLKTIGRPLARYGARAKGGCLAAVALFGNAGATHAVPEAYRAQAITLQRGACAHWAHEHTASWFIPRACAMAARQHGWRIFVAYADESAGEIGTVYQAANWRYVGQSTTRRVRGKPRDRDHFRRIGWPKGRWISDRAFYSHKGLTLDAPGWERATRPAKHKYVWIEAPRQERRELAALFESLPYPKTKRLAC